MIFSLPTGGRGQIVAAALLLIVITVVWLAAIRPMVALYDGLSQQVSALQERATRETALIEAMPTLSRALQNAAQMPTRALLTGNSDAIAGAALQEQVQTMALASNTQLISIETLPAEQVSTYRRIGVRIELSAQLTGVVALLRAIEEAPSMMLVDDLHLTGTPTGSLIAQLPLDGALTVYAFRNGTVKGDQR